jgi:hypothetical protein
MHRTNGKDSVGALITSSWPGARRSPTFTATSANQSKSYSSEGLGNTDVPQRPSPRG